MGIASILSGIIILIFVHEPVRGSSEPEMKNKLTYEQAERYKVQFDDLRKVLKIPTIRIAILQGLAGSMPWVILGAFLILWLVEERGLSTQQAPLVFGIMLIGTAISNVLGGYLGDWANQKNPKYGRTIIGQLSVIFGIPLTIILIKGTDNWNIVQLTAFCFFIGLLISWPGKGAKEPMMAAVVPPELRATAFAMTTFVENGFAAIVALIFGLIADKIDLQTAIFWTVPIPWIFCAIMFSGFYFTYPKDHEKQRLLLEERARELGINNGN